MAALVSRFAVRFALASALAAVALTGFGFGAITADHAPIAAAHSGDGDDVWCC